MDTMANTSCTEFAALLARKVSVPGGGAAAAYVGALSVALGSMAGNYTVGKKAYAHVEDDIQRLLANGERLRGRLLELVEEDAAAFEPLSRAYGIPQDSPGRAEALEAATKGACVAPLEMMRCACEVIELLEEMGQKASRLLISDVGCGALLARAALEAASMNVFVNTKALGNRAQAQALEEECDRMLGAYVPRAAELAASVMSCIRA